MPHRAQRARLTGAPRRRAPRRLTPQAMTTWLATPHTESSDGSNTSSTSSATTQVKHEVQFSELEGKALKIMDIPEPTMKEVRDRAHSTTTPPPSHSCVVSSPFAFSPRPSPLSPITASSATLSRAWATL